MLASSLLVVVSGLSLEIASPQQTAMVGEPVKLVVRWKATEDLPPIMVEDPEFGNRTLSFLVDGGAGAIRYKEQPRTLADPVDEPVVLAKGDEVVVNYTLLTGQYDGAAATTPIFAAPGEYRVKAVYTRGNQTAESNGLAFSVTAPTGAEQDVWGMLSREPHLRSGDGPLERVQQAVRANSDSRHLSWAKVVLYRRRANELHNRYDPDTGESFWQLDAPSLRAALASRYRNMATELLVDNWGAFEEERLFQALTYAAAAGESQLAQQARQQLLSTFPRSMAAGEVRRFDAEMAEAAIEDRETDDTPPPATDKTPPTLALVPSPSSLWPPNHKLVPITVTVTVSDNVDSNPSVKLTSVTCDDGCDTAQDVAGATLNTDDRSFQLRAARAGGGTGRTYTITYVAKDASGNTTTKATMVRVPHDQGRGSSGAP